MTSEVAIIEDDETEEEKVARKKKEEDKKLGDAIDHVNKIMAKRLMKFDPTRYRPVSALSKSSLEENSKKATHQANH